MRTFESDQRSLEFISVCDFVLRLLKYIIKSLKIYSSTNFAVIPWANEGEEKRAQHFWEKIFSQDCGE